MVVIGAPDACKFRGGGEGGVLGGSSIFSFLYCCLCKYIYLYIYIYIYIYIHMFFLGGHLPH